MVSAYTLVSLFPIQFSRGDEFRTTFADLGNIRGLLPSNINIMALTATATKATLATVKKRLAMQDPVIIGLTPDRPNIKLIVDRCPDLHELCVVLAKWRNGLGLQKQLFSVGLYRIVPRCVLY